MAKSSKRKSSKRKSSRQPVRSNPLEDYSANPTVIIQLNYTTPITDDVLGHLDRPDFLRTLIAIADLPPRGSDDMGRLTQPESRRLR
jgi:hypothetical protein